MNMYTKECLEYFLAHQDQLYDEPVAEPLEEAEEFLDECMAQVVDSLDEVREYLSEDGMDVDDLTDEELADAAEVFSLPDGSYLIVEG